MFEKLKKIEERCSELEKLLSDPRVLSDRNQYQSYAKELAGISDIVRKYRDYCAVRNEIDKIGSDKAEHKNDKEFLSLADDELKHLEEKSSRLTLELEKMLIEEDKDANKGVIVEIRAGTGGEEAGLFAGDLYRMYTKYAAKNGWSVEILSSRPSQLNGFKEIIFGVRGKSVYGNLKFESGVHRVQRVPETEASGRIHTSAATVAILPEAEEVELKIDSKDLKIDVYRSSGCGGQSVNTTDSAVRITHLPTGLVVTCQDERSQLKNKTKAMRVLRARLLDDLKAKHSKQISSERKSMVKSGDRSEKIRTYNYPERRVTDHRIGLTLYKLDSFLEGEIDEMIETLKKEEGELKKKGLNVKKD